MPQWRRWIDDEGSASLEFVSAGLLMLLPLVYLVLAMGAIQGASLAVDGASRQAVRVFVQSPTVAEAEGRAQRAIDFALADYGLKPDAATVTIACSPKPTACLTRLGTVTVRVTARVTLPLVPPALHLDAPLSIPLASTATERVSRFWGAR
jgi:hypothetical protein